MVELSLERVADAVAALRSEAWDRPEQDRRVLPRIPVWAHRTIQLTGIDQRHALDVWLTDLACGGMGFLSPRPLAVGQEFVVTLPAAETSASTVLCQVVHCQPAPNGAFTVGSRFLREVNDEAQSAPAPADRQAC
jgi:hypothetical protein